MAWYPILILQRDLTTHFWTFFISVGNLKPKLERFFKLILKPKFVLLNCLPAKSCSSCGRASWPARSESWVCGIAAPTAAWWGRIVLTHSPINYVRKGDIFTSWNPDSWVSWKCFNFQSILFIMFSESLFRGGELKLLIFAIKSRKEKNTELFINQFCNCCPSW